MNKAEKCEYHTAYEQMKVLGAVRIAANIVRRRYGDKAGDVFHRRAVHSLVALNRRYNDIPKGERLHTSCIFPVAAAYMTLKKIYPDDAMSIIENAARISVTKKARVIKRFVSIPGGKRSFIRMVHAVSQRIFGYHCGFDNRDVRVSSGECAFDIYSCPYVKWLNELGCPELIHVYCKNDEYTYGGLDGISFIRKGTIGTGAEKCDFRFKID